MLNGAKSYSLGVNMKYTMNRQNSTMKGVKVACPLSQVFGLLTYLFLMLTSLQSMALNPSGDLRIEALNAPNFVVDSNIETPATYGPKAVHLGAHFCNDGANDLTDVVVNIGNYIGSPSNSTPGTYPVETVDEVANGWLYNGDFSLTHGTSNLSEATRLINAIPAGTCVTQYWMITYPQLDAGGNAVFGENKVFADDLVLDYDFWATANDGGISLTADQTYSATMRRELSAAANKIWPNTTSKVPTEYLDAIEEVLGWRPTTGSESTIAGNIGTVSGIWYDFGVVNQGFDNNGDLIPDYNAWAQPVGDPTIFNSSCFKLIKTYGILVVKHNTGVDELIPFVDELYYSNIASDNTGMVGLVFYDFQALDGTCSIQISPYQEVASGRDNEKFNGDYGTFTGFVTSTTPEVTFDKIANKTTVALGDTITYDLTADNTAGTIAVGDASVGSPLVFHDSIPTGTQYVAGTADLGNTLPAGVSVNVLYSTDNGTTWSTTEPVIATDTTDLQWWLDAPLAIGATATVTFTTTVPIGFSDLFVINDASLGFGSSSSFAFDDEIVYIQGTLNISGTVFEDDGSGVGAVSADGLLNGSEPGHGSVTVTLYLDNNADGIIDITDTIWASTVSANDGTYSFANLPDGNFIVEIDKTDVDLFTGSTTGWGLTTAENFAVTLNGFDVTGLDFGIAPALEITKTLNGVSPVGEGSEISYNISIRNLLADTNGGLGLATCEYDAYATNVLAAKTQIVDEANAVINTTGSSNEPEGSFAVTSGGGDGFLAVNQFDITAQPEAIQKVELVFLVQSVAATWVDDVMDFQLRDNADTVLLSGQLTTNQLNALSTTTNEEVILDVTSAFNWDYTTSVTEDLHAYLEENKTAASDSDIRIDAVSLRFTTDCGGGGGTYDINKTLSPVPLEDSFDATYLQFVSSIPPADAFNNVTGTINWNDIGPLNAGASRTIQVKFFTQLPGSTSQLNVLNTAFSNTSKFANGLDANSDTDDALIDIDPRVELSGTVWNDSTGSVAGWSGSVGYEGGDTFVSGVSINLYACLDSSNNIYTSSTATVSKSCESVQNAGTWTVVDSKTTDANGDYLFTGLSEGYYYVEVNTATLPGAVTQTGDPDELGVVCSNCDDLWQYPTLSLNALTYVPAVPGDIIDKNFGYDVNPAVYGNVWEDKNGDGSQGIGELALSGWTVELVDAGCTPSLDCPTTNTDANGDYSFANLLTATTYTISITSPFPGDTSWSETFESDATTNNSISVTLSGGEISGSHDFAFQQSGLSSIGDFIFADWNGDGIQDANEEGIPGITINLYEDIDNDGVLDISVDPIVVTTSSTGSYNFTNLPAASYFVVVDETTLPTGYSQSSDPNEIGLCTLCDARDLVTVDGTATAGTGVVITADFGYVPSGLYSIGDFVFNDVNGNGAVNVGDTGIANITVTLQVDLDSDGNYENISNTTTDADGLYNFANLPDANYRIIVEATDVDLPTDSFGNDGVFTTATQIDLALNGSDDNTADFGYNVLAAIGDTLFFDDNANAIQDTNELGISGVTIELYSAGADRIIGNGDDVLVTSDVTDSAGHYLFTQIQPLFDGNGDAVEYLVVVNTGTLPAGVIATGDPDRDGIACADTSFDSSPNPPPACDSQTAQVLNYNTNFMGADFGYLPLGAFGDQVWNDLDGDGIKDTNEPGLSGVTITLTGPGGTFTTTTDTDGLYSFGNKIDGTWSITIDASNSNPGNSLENYTANFDPDGILDGVTQLVINSGSVVSVGGMACSDCALTADFGYQLNGALSLSGSLCFEDGVTDNGSCSDADDNGVSSQPVYLYNSAGILVASVNTDNNGDYLFSSLPSGNYQLAIGTTLAPVSFGSLTTTLVNSPDNPDGTVLSITDTGTSIIQALSLAANTSLVDFAFNLTASVDFGDLPSPFATTLSTGGAYHILDATDTLYLGVTVADTEADGAPTTAANGDGDDDADGIGYGLINNWTNGANGGLIQLQVGGSLASGYVVGWIDFNNDGDFTDTNEMVISSSVSNGFAYFNITVPIGASLDSQTYSRFRVFETKPPVDVLAYSGAYEKGEVEDYLLDFRVPGSIGDSVWLDEDGDGIEDIFELGIANVTVDLFDSGNNLIATTKTDANGQYLFADVFAGNYYVEINSGIPMGLTTAPGTTDPSAIFVFGNGEQKRDVDFGYIPTIGTAVVGDQVFSDANNNGQQDPGEIGIANITMNLASDAGIDGLYGTGDDVIVATTSTATDGSYLFVGVVAGDYVVTLDDTTLILAGYSVTSGPQSPGDNETEPFTIVEDQIYTDADFGYFNPGLSSYTDRVWLDANNDSAFANEQGIQGVTVNLIDGSGNILATTTTAADGVFSFTGLPNGFSYNVVIADSDNALGTLDTTTIGASNGFVAITTTGSDIDVSNSAPSFGYYEPGGVSGLIWSDANGNGARDAGEASIPGVIVELQGTGCISGLTCPTTITSFDGSYLFDGYLPSNYTIVVNPVAGTGTVVTNYVSQTGDPDATLDSQTSTTITAGTIDENNDFGYQNITLADISGTVFYDTDADGTYEINGDDGDLATTNDNEYGLSKVTIELRHSNGNIVASTLAAGDGSYSFPDLLDDTYTVVITDTAGVLSGYESTSGLDYRTISLAGVDVSGIDFGYVDESFTASIGDTVWLDSDNDGFKDPDEPGLSDVNLNLYEDTNNNGVFDGADSLIASTLTDANGLYRFSKLPPGNYFVDIIEADLPNNLTATTFVSGSSDRIELSESEFVEDADFGFAANTGTGIISGLVWSDVDSNGIADASEVGIGDGSTIVTITAYDVNNPGTSFTTNSKPNGTWMITNLPPGDYSILYDSNDIPPAYVSPTQPTNFSNGNDTYNLTLVANQTINNLDFGFDPGLNATGGLSGTIYNDLDKNSSQDAGEAGIWDVSLDLLDCGAGTCSDGDEIIISSLKTDTNGDYSFVGIPAGNYLIAISDVEGVLDGLNSTEILPASNTVVVGVTTVDVDAGFASGNALGSIGNLIFLDIDNSSSFQIGEPGIAGVSVQCWSDTNSNGVIEPGIDNLIRTVFTDDNGEYYCNSVPSGFYIVRVTDKNGLLAGLTSTGVAFTDTDNISQTSPYPLQTAGPNTKADFGYLGNLTISGVVFEDENNNTINEASEAKVLNSLVYLYKDLNADGILDAGEPRISTATSLVDGSYLFTGIPTGDYLLVPDVDGTSVSGYSQTTQSTSNGIIAVNLGSSSSGNDFGFYDSGVTTTPVTLSSFIANSHSNGIDFVWSTETETGNIGFRIIAEDSSQQLIYLTDLIPSHVVNSLEPQIYNTSISKMDIDNVWISDIDIYGNETKHGPFIMNKLYGKVANPVSKINWSEIRSQHRERKEIRDARAENVSAVDLRVSKDGIYRLSYEDILSAGLDLDQVNIKQISLKLNGQSVPIYINSNSNSFSVSSWIEFIGEKVKDSLYTETNLYRLSISNGVSNETSVITENESELNQINTSMYYQASLKKDENNRYSFVAPNEDPWFRDMILAYQTDAQLEYVFEVNDLIAGGGKLNFDIWGGTDFVNLIDHHIQVTLNDTLVFDDIFDGLDSIQASQILSDNTINQGGNTVKVDVLLENGILYSLVNVNWIELQYSSSLIAKDDYLNFRGFDDVIFSNNFEDDTLIIPGIQIDGFSVDSGSVYAINGAKIERLKHVAFTPSDKGYTASFADISKQHDYIIAATPAIMTPEISPVRVNEDLFLGAPDYLMISHPDFIDGLTSLKSFHENNGLNVKIVDVEDIYYQYSGGKTSPEAISEYISMAKDQFRLQYVLLVGGDSYDYLNNLGLGSFSFIPSYYVTTSDVISYTPSDVPFVDFNHDNVPDLAIGRFPVRTVQELESLINKTIQYANNSYTRTSVFAADRKSSGGNFPLYSESLVNELNNNWSITRAYLGDETQLNATNLLLDEINNGVALVNYFGHSGYSTWSFDRLLDIENIQNLNNLNKATVVVQWGCWNAYHVSPANNTMAHNFLVNNNGAAAVLGASTLTKIDSDNALSQLYIPLASQTGMSLGKALLQAKQQLAEQHPDYLDMLLGYLLLGDPAIEIGK